MALSAIDATSTDPYGDISRSVAAKMPWKRIDLPLSSLYVELAFQRQLEKSRVNAIVDEFHPAALNQIKAASVRHGEQTFYSTLDGQHTLEVLRKKGYERIEVLYIDNTTVAERAWLFDLLNRRRKNTNADNHYKAGLVWGDPNDIKINALLDKHSGLTYMADKAHPMNIPGISTIRKLLPVYGSDLIDATLGVFEGWAPTPGDLIKPTNVNFILFEGVCRFLSTEYAGKRKPRPEILTWALSGFERQTVVKLVMDEEAKYVRVTNGKHSLSSGSSKADRARDVFKRLYNRKARDLGEAYLQEAYTQPSRKAE